MDIAFDTLAYAKKLRSAGFTEEQAEIQAEALAHIVDEKLSTKRDLKDLESRLIIKMGSMLVVTIGILAILMKL
jgi:hypothetical protein